MRRQGCDHKRLTAVLACLLLGLSAGMSPKPVHAGDVHPNGWYWPAGTSTTTGDRIVGWLQWNPNRQLYHLAQDFPSITGLPVYAIANGTVQYSQTDIGGYGPDGTPGGALVALHRTSTGQEFQALYGHLNNPVPAGTTVTAGQVLGYINAFNPPHVHFGIRPGNPSDGRQFQGYTSDSSQTYGYVNPVSFLGSNYPYSGAVVKPGDATGDGAVNATDISKVERIVAGLDSATPGADANQDGKINAQDITSVERKIAGLD